ncbi:MAG: hypothetical protein ABR950_06235 [Candidatus Dormibacteria bacterium]
MTSAELGEPAVRRAAVGHASMWAPSWSLACRLVGAAGVAASGAIHFQLWASGYSVISVIGPLFLLDAIGSWLVGLALLGTRLRVVVAAAILMELGAIAALALAGTVGIFGFRETGTGVGGQIMAAYGTEALAVILLAASLALAPGGLRLRRG